MNFTCQKCGYQMNAQECLSDALASPREGDLAVCLGCAAYYELRAGQWQPLNDEVLARLPPDTRAELEIVQWVIRQVITEDLAFNQQLKRKR